MFFPVLRLQHHLHDCTALMQCKSKFKIQSNWLSLQNSAVTHSIHIQVRLKFSEKCDVISVTDKGEVVPVLN